MIRRYFFLIMFLILSAPAFAQEIDVQTALDYKIDKMTKELKLTDAQVNGIRPIIKDYLIKRTSFLKDVGNQGIIDHVSVKSTLQGFKENEYQKLSQILSEDQMTKLKNKDQLMAAFNPDNVENTDDDDVGLTANGANFKF